MKTIRWGIIGLGNIAHKFAKDLAWVENCSLQAVASSDSERALRFANEHKAKKAYSSYDELFRDKEVDVVYVASLHPFHAKHSIDAMEHGKAVLCEKPLAMNADEVRQLIGTAKKNNVFLMEGLWTRFNPAFNQVLEWIRNQEIGTLRYINSTFSFNGLDRGVDSRLFDPKKGGGSLLDIGIYPLFLAYYLLGIPNEIKASAILTNEGVDEQLSFIFSYPKAQALSYSSFTHNEDMCARICGESGEIYMSSRWHETPEIKLVIEGKERNPSIEFKGKGYTYEIEEVNECIRNKQIQSSKWTWQNSLEMNLIMDSIRKQTGICYPSDG